MQRVDVLEQFLHAFADEGDAVAQVLDRRVDFVRDAGGEAADGFEPVARSHALFGGLAIGDVEARAHDAGEIAVGIVQRNLGGEDHAVHAARLVVDELFVIDERLARLEQRLLVGEKLLGHLAREEIEVGLADQFRGRDAHAIRDQLVAGGEAAVGVLGVDEGRDQVDHRAQHIALVRQRIRQIAALGAVGFPRRPSASGSMFWGRLLTTNE